MLKIKSTAGVTTSDKPHKLEVPTFVTDTKTKEQNNHAAFVPYEVLQNSISMMEIYNDYSFSKLEQRQKAALLIKTLLVQGYTKVCNELPHFEEMELGSEYNTL